MTKCMYIYYTCLCRPAMFVSLTVRLKWTGFRPQCTVQNPTVDSDAPITPQAIAHRRNLQVVEPNGEPQPYLPVGVVVRITLDHQRTLWYVLQSLQTYSPLHTHHENLGMRPCIAGYLYQSNFDGCMVPNAICCLFSTRQPCYGEHIATGNPPVQF